MCDDWQGGKSGQCSQDGQGGWSLVSLHDQNIYGFYGLNHQMTNAHAD